jgi:tripartite-type tricarboxylate transporter receptor subunit TctC
MKFIRRAFLHLAAGVAVAPTSPRLLWARGYPVRLIGQWLSDRLGQPFIVENRRGANGNLATEAVVNASPDSYTLLMLTLTDAVNGTLYQNLNYHFDRDLTPVAGLSRDPDVMVVNPAFPAKTVPEFISYAKANPGKINMASAGVGTSPHMAGELFKYMTGIEMTHVAYRGSAPALTDLLGGQVQVYFAPISASIEYIRAGKLRPLAVTTATRAAALPSVPAVGDFVAGYEMSAWFGIGAPKNTPAEVVDKLNNEINSGLADPGVTARLAALGSSAFPVSPSNFGKFITAEAEKWAKVIKVAGIKAE